MRETERASDILKDLRKNHGCFTFNIAGSFYQKRGMPDSCIIYNGINLWVEFKGANTPVEPLQIRTMNDMKKAGANVFLVRFIGEKEWLIDDLVHIKFNRRSDGSMLLLDALLKMCEKGDRDISTNSSAMLH